MNFYFYLYSEEISHFIPCKKTTLYFICCLELESNPNITLTNYLYLKPLAIYCSLSHDVHSLHPCSSNLLSSGSREIIHMKLILVWCPISSSLTSFQPVITYNLANPGYYALHYAKKNTESLSSG